MYIILLKSRIFLGLPSVLDKRISKEVHTMYQH